MQKAILINQWDDYSIEAKIQHDITHYGMKRKCAIQGIVTKIASLIQRIIDVK